MTAFFSGVVVGALVVLAAQNFAAIKGLIDVFRARLGK